jgi:hypothetical protein
VPLPLVYVRPVIPNDACALKVMAGALLGPALNARAVISSLPDTVAVIVKVLPFAPAAIVIKKSMCPVPLIVFDADAFAVTPDARPLNDAVTVSAIADAAGLLNATRTTKVMPATYVPLPLVYVKLVIANAACALIAITKLLVSGPSDLPDISSVPDTVVVIVTVGWLGAPAVIVIKKSITIVPLTVFDAEAFAEMPVAPPNDKGAVTVSAVADGAGLLNVTRTTNCWFATYVPLPLAYVMLVMANAACGLIAISKLVPDDPLNARLEYCPVPVQVALIVTDGWFETVEMIDIKKSIVVVTFARMVFTAETLFDKPVAPL